MEELRISKTQNQFSHNESKIEKLVRFLLLITVIVIGLLFIIKTLSVSSPKSAKKKLIDPDAVTEEQKIMGFTTEKIYNHFNDLIDKYFQNEKKCFNGWQIQYKKNKDWNFVTWINNDGTEGTGHYEGVCDYEGKIIYLNDDYFPRYDSHDDVILHEMIHVICTENGHGPEFMNHCARIAEKSHFTKEQIFGYSGWGSVE